MLRLERRSRILSTKSLSNSSLFIAIKDRSNRNSCYSIIPVIRMRDRARDSFFHPLLLHLFHGRKMADSCETIRSHGAGWKRDQRSEIKRQQRGIRWNNGIGGEEGGGERGKHRDWDVVKILYTSWKGMLTVKFKWRRSTGFMVVVYLIAVSLVAFHSVFHRGTINERKNARSENKIIIVKR